VTLVTDHPRVQTRSLSSILPLHRAELGVPSSLPLVVTSGAVVLAVAQVKAEADDSGECLSPNEVWFEKIAQGTN
jgi:hypothetical protein